MKNKELRKLSDKKLIELKKDLELSLAKSKTRFVTGEDERFKGKGIASSGKNTKETKMIRITTARLNSILNQRGLSEELCKNKPRSKRRERRLRGRNK